MCFPPALKARSPNPAFDRAILPVRSSKGESVHYFSQAWVAIDIPCLWPHLFLFCPHIFLYSVLFVIGFRPHLGNPGGSHLRTLNGICEDLFSKCHIHRIQEAGHDCVFVMLPSVY